MYKQITILLIGSLITSAPLSAQFRTTYLGATIALNSLTTGPAAPQPAPMVATVSPETLNLASAAANAPPLSVIGAPLNIVGLTNYKNIGFVYQSSLFWWLGFFQYSGVAQSLVYSSDGSQAEIGNTGIYEPVGPDVRNAVNFFMNNGDFTMFRDFPNRNINLVISANLPIPVQQNPQPGGFILYTPSRVPVSTYVPLNFQ
jgi:hypothetical protein